MVRKKTIRLLLYDYQRTARYYTIYRTFKSWSSDDFTTIPRLSAGRSYDYSRSCYDYSSRNAATIADLYWLSGESPKRAAAKAVNGSAPPALSLSLDFPAGWRVPDCKPPGWHGLRYAAPLHSYIPYYNRAAVLTCAASGVSLVSGTRWKCCGAVIRSSIAQAVL